MLVLAVSLVCFKLQCFRSHVFEFLEAAALVKLLAVLLDKAYIIKILNLFALHFKKAVGCQLVILILPTCLLKFSPAAWSPWSPCKKKKCWPITIWFDSDLPKASHEGPATRNWQTSALPLARQGFWMEDLTFSLGQRLQKSAITRRDKLPLLLQSGLLLHWT